MRVAKRRGLQFFALLMAVSLLAGILLGNASALTTGEAAQAEQAEPAAGREEWVQNEKDGTQVRKSLQPVDGSDDTYWLQFEVKGQDKKVEGTPVEVVLLLDYSGSMKDNEAEMEKAAKNFISRIFAAGEDNRIAVVAFSADVMSGRSYPQFSKWIAKANESGLLDALDEEKKSASGGTNLKAAFEKTAELLNTSKREKPKSQRVVVTFTDGIPNIKSDTYDKYNQSVAVKQYFENTFDKAFPSNQVPRYCVYWAPGASEQSIYVPTRYVSRNRDTTFNLSCKRNGPYYYLNATDLAKTLASLYGPTDARLSVANASVPDELLDNILSAYADQILKFAQNAEISDTLTEGFDFVLPQEGLETIQWRPYLEDTSDGQNPWRGLTKKNPNGPKQDRYYEIDETNKTISFHFDAIGEPGDCVRFQIKTNDKILSMETHTGADGKSYVDTNTTADLTYTSPKADDPQCVIPNIPSCEVRVVRPGDYLHQSKTAGESTVVTEKDGYFFDINLKAWGDLQVETEPYDIMLMLDVSGSMSINSGAIVASSMEELAQLNKASPANTYLSMVPFHVVHPGTFPPDDPRNDILTVNGFVDFTDGQWRYWDSEEKKQPISDAYFASLGGKIATTSFQSMKDETKHFIETVAQYSPDSRVSVGWFSTFSGIEMPFGETIENNLPQVLASVDGLKSSGLTSHDLALNRAAQAFQDRPSDRKKAVVLFTDGSPQCDAQRPGVTAADIANRANSLAEGLKGQNVTLFTVGYALRDLEIKGTDWTATSFLRALSSQPLENHAFTENSVEGLHEAFRDIAVRIIDGYEPVTVRDYLSEGFRLVDGAGNLLEAGAQLDNGGVLGKDEKGWYVEWAGQRIPAFEAMAWSRTITVQYTGEIPPEGIASIETNVPDISGLYVDPVEGKEKADVPFDRPAVTLPEQMKELTIIKHLKEPADSAQSFLFRITKPNQESFYEVIHIEKGEQDGSKTITGLPSGDYRIEELTDWSWNYQLQGVSDGDAKQEKPDAGNGKTVAIQPTESAHQVTFTNGKLAKAWLAARDYVTNYLNQK